MNSEDSRLSPANPADARRSTPAEQAHAIEIGRALDAEDGGYPADAVGAGGVERETIARIIDPLTWRDRDAYVDLMNANGGCASETIRTIADRRTKESLRTADRILAALRAQPAEHDGLAMVHVVFDGPPGHESGRFVECEAPDGHSVNVGEWHERNDGFWELRIPLSRQPVEADGWQSRAEKAEALLRDIQHWISQAHYNAIGARELLNRIDAHPSANPVAAASTEQGEG